MALARAWKQMSWLYYQYLLVTALYMLEPWERTVFSILPGPWRGGRGWGMGAWAASSRAQGLGGGEPKAERRIGGNRARGLALRGGHSWQRSRGPRTRSRGWGGRQGARTLEIPGRL